MVNLLNYLDHNKAVAIDIMKRELGWQYYGGKHYESVWTPSLVSGLLSPRKFGFALPPYPPLRTGLRWPDDPGLGLAEMLRDPYADNDSEHRH